MVFIPSMAKAKHNTSVSPAASLLRFSTERVLPGTYSTVSMSILVFPKKCARPLIDPERVSREYIRTFVVIFAQPRETRVREKKKTGPGRRTWQARQGNAAGAWNFASLGTHYYSVRTPYLIAPYSPVSPTPRLTHQSLPPVSYEVNTVKY